MTTLTPTQQTIITRLEERLEDLLWEEQYYGENPNQELWELYNQGLEVTFNVKLKTYEGYNSPLNK